MSEILKPPQSIAIVQRLFYQNEQLRGMPFMDRIRLTPGKGVLFFGLDNEYQVPTKVTQQEFVMLLSEFNLRLQLAALLEKNTGSLLLTQGSADLSWGINKQVPRSERIITNTVQNSQFLAVWGENQSEALQQLYEYENLQASRN